MDEFYDVFYDKFANTLAEAARKIPIFKRDCTLVFSIE